MNEKELKEFKAVLVKQRHEVHQKGCPRLLNKLGLLISGGDLHGCCFFQ